MHEPVDPRLLKQRREDVLREVRINRPVRELRAHREGRPDRTSDLAWELKRHAGRLLKRSKVRRRTG